MKATLVSYKNYNNNIVNVLVENTIDKKKALKKVKALEGVRQAIVCKVVASSNVTVSYEDCDCYVDSNYYSCMAII